MNTKVNTSVQVALSTAELPVSMTKEYTPDLMPFHIEHNGPVPRSTYMKVSTINRGVGKPEEEEEEEEKEEKKDGGEKDERYTSTFRGRTIHGMQVPLPAGYSGLILKRGEDGGNNSKFILEGEARGEKEKVKGRRSLRSDNRRQPQKAEESRSSSESRVGVDGRFSGVRVWQADIPVDGGRDEYIRSVGEWTALADEIQKRILEEEEMEGGCWRWCMAAPALPHDVWLNIAAFLPVLSLRALYSLNSSLSNIALDARYRQISFIYWDDRLLKNLIRLRDPYIARRVKILHIYPGFLKEVIDKHSRELTPPPTSAVAPKSSSSFRVRLADITQQLREYQDKVFNPPACSTTTNNRGGAIHDALPNLASESVPLYDMHPRQAMDKLRDQLRTVQDVMTVMLELLRSLPSLTDYYVTWYGLHPGVDGFTNLAVPLIATPLLLPALTKLSLDISLENLHALCSTSSFHLSMLEELHLHLHSDHVRPSPSSSLSSSSSSSPPPQPLPPPPPSSSSSIYTRFAHALSSLSPHLRLLSIETHEPMNISPFFINLPYLSKLETLALALPVQKPHLGNPRALGRFLRRQGATIKCLRIRATQHDGSGASNLSQQQYSWRSVGTPDPWSLNEWIKTALGSETGEEYAEWYYSGDVARESISEEEQQVEQDEDEEWTEYDLEALESLEVSSNLIPLETALYLAERFGGRVKSLGVLGSVKSFEFVKELLKVLGRSTTRNITTTTTTTTTATAVEDCSTPIELGGDAEPIWQWLTPAPSSPTSPSSNDPTTPMTSNWNLRTLKLGPVQLSPELLDLLAHNLPGLHHLELIVKHFLPSQDDVPIYAASRGGSSGAAKHGTHTNTTGGASSGGGSMEGDGVQLDEQVYEFLETMQNEWSWSWWGLKTIAVFSESTMLSMPLPLPLSNPPPSSPPLSAITSPTVSMTPVKSPKRGKSSLALSRTNSLQSESDSHSPEITLSSSKGKVVSKTQESVTTVTSSSTLRDSPVLASSPCSLVRTSTSSSRRSQVQVEDSEPAPHESSLLCLPCPILSSDCLFSNPNPFSSPLSSTPTLASSSNLPRLPSPVSPNTIPPLQSLQLPSTTTTINPASMPVSPSSSVSPSPTTPTPTRAHPYPHSHSHSHSHLYPQSQPRSHPRSQSQSSHPHPHANFASNLFSGGLNWTRGGGGGSKPSQNSSGYAGGGGSVSTSALPSGTSHISGGDASSGRRGSLASVATSMPSSSNNWRGGSKDMFMGMGGNTGVGFVLDRERERERERSASVTAGGFSTSNSTPTSTKHVFSFLKSKSKPRKDKEKKEKEKDVSSSVFGGAVASAHAGLLPIHGAASSFAAAFVTSGQLRQQQQQQQQFAHTHTHIPIPLPPYSPPFATATTSETNDALSGSSITTPTTPTSILSLSSVPTPTLAHATTTIAPAPSSPSSPPRRPSWILPTANADSSSLRSQVQVPNSTTTIASTSTATTRMWVPLPSNQMFIRTRDHNRSWLKEHHRKKKNEEKEKEKERQTVAAQRSQLELQSQRQQLQQERERERERERARVRDVQLQLREREREKERRRERELERERERLARRQRYSSGRKKSSSATTGGGKTRRRKVDVSSSFGSVSSEVSGISTISGYSVGSFSVSVGGGGSPDMKNVVNSSTATAAAVGVVEERITFEVALGEVLGRCLPGVRVVR